MHFEIHGPFLFLSWEKKDIQECFRKKIKKTNILVWRKIEKMSIDGRGGVCGFGQIKNKLEKKKDLLYPGWWELEEREGLCVPVGGGS